MSDPVSPATRTLAVPELVPVAGGEFVMGDESGRKDERPAHRVRVGSFRAARRPISNREYVAFVHDTGTAPAPWASAEGFDEPDQPVVGVSWSDAIAYCEWLAGQTGIPFRLPTEAEREFAARGGQADGAWPWSGRDHPLAAELAALNRPHVPRPDCANGYGLLCMAENVHEWCSDWYGADYYAASPQASPSGPDGGARRASRGGSWRHSVKFTRLTARSSLPPEYRYNDYGFRVYADMAVAAAATGSRA